MRIAVVLRSAILFEAEHNPRQQFKVDLVADACIGRTDLEVAESLLTPFQEGITLAVSLVIKFLIDRVGVRGSKSIDLNGMIDDEFDRLNGVDFLGVTSQVSHGITHGGKIHNRRHAGKILHEDARRQKSDFAGRIGSRPPPRQRLDVLRAYNRSVLTPQQVLQQNAQGIRKAAGFIAFIFQGRNLEDFVIHAPDAQGGPCIKAVLHGILPFQPFSGLSLEKQAPPNAVEPLRVLSHRFATGIDDNKSAFIAVVVSLSKGIQGFNVSAALLCGGGQPGGGCRQFNPALASIGNSGEKNVTKNVENIQIELFDILNKIVICRRPLPGGIGGHFRSQKGFMDPAASPDPGDFDANPVLLAFNFRQLVPLADLHQNGSSGFRPRSHVDSGTGHEKTIAACGDTAGDIEKKADEKQKKQTAKHDLRSP